MGPSLKGKSPLKQKRFLLIVKAILKEVCSPHIQTSNQEVTKFVSISKFGGKIIVVYRYTAKPPMRKSDRNTKLLGMELMNARGYMLLLL